jgi:hypothetical protein
LAESYSRAGEDAGHRITLWDFTGYGPYSTEAVPIEHHVLHWFWDSVYYNHSLGDLIVMRIFGLGNAHFGVLLDSNNIDRHLGDLREQQRLYREGRAADVQRVRQVNEFTVEEGARGRQGAARQ